MGKERQPYVMPQALIGPALWYDSPKSTEPVPCLVTSTGPRSVNCTIFATDNRAGIPRDGVRHISDPELSENPDRSNGCWDYTDDQKLIHDLCDEFDRLKGTPVVKPKS